MKQELELEIQQLKGSLSVLKHMEDDEDVEILKKVDNLQKDLRDKEQSLQDIDALNQTLIIKERESNDELQEARQALVDVCVVLSNLSSYLLFKLICKGISMRFSLVSLCFHLAYGLVVFFMVILLAHLKCYMN